MCAIAEDVTDSTFLNVSTGSLSLRKPSQHEENERLWVASW
jgi:hypothetical protein